LMQDIDSFNRLFDQVIAHYHLRDHVDQGFVNPYQEEGIDSLLYHKCWIATGQWHFEDIIRSPSIDPMEALAIKRRIDASNQERRDVVELIDDSFLNLFGTVTLQPDAKLNTECPAWAIDRLSILALKIFRMKEQLYRTDVDEDHLNAVKNKLDILLIQRKDLTQAIGQLLEDLRAGRRIMKVYRQMKMYNDPSLNPVLYGDVK